MELFANVLSFIAKSKEEVGMGGDLSGYMWNKNDCDSFFHVIGIYEKYAAGKPPKLINEYKISRWVLNYSYNEGMLYKVGKKKQAWKTRDANVFNLYPPGTVLTENSISADFPRKSISLFFYANENTGLGNLVQKHSYASFTENKGNRLLSLLMHILSIASNEKDRAFWKANAGLCNIIDILVNYSENRQDEYYLIRGKEKKTQYSKTVQSALDYIYKHSYEPIYLKDIANYASVSVSSLSHKYFQETGETPLQTHMRLKIELAKEMILAGEPLKVIVSRLSLNDIFYLSKTFKKIAGITIDKFRKDSKL